LKTHNTSLGEIEAALTKVKLANKLGCTTQELIATQIGCPKEKIGAIIGKKGSMIKKIEAATNVNIDVDKDTNGITVLGNQASIDIARAEIDKLIRTEAVEVDAPKRLLSYLGEKHISVIQDLREANDDVTIDILRRNGKLTLRGVPERVEEVKKTILGLDVVTKERKLEGRELSIVIGKKGATIGGLVLKHKVSIDVEKTDNTSNTAVLIGPPSLVDAALSDIEILISENQEVAEKIHVDLILKRILLYNKGRNMKALQRKVNETFKESDGNCILSFDTEHPEKIDALLVVKARQSIASTASELTKAGLKEFENLILHTIVDPYIVPRIIGKNGESIKKLTEGKPCFIEVSRTTGNVSLGATTVEELTSLESEINELVSINSILRLDADPATMKAQYREFNRSNSKAEMNSLVSLDLDTKNKCFIIRGKKNDLEKAKALLESYLVNNCVDEVPITANDLVDLLSGGRGSMISRLSNELEANLRADRDRKVIIVRGTKENVRAAKAKLDQFLNGGDGHSVVKVSVTANIVGGIIGKGGKNRQQMERKYGVSVQISDSHVVAIRGPEEKVAECKIEVLKMVATARVTQTLPVTEDQQKSLENNGTLKRVMREIPTQINFEDGNATVRGYFYDVRDAVALLNEQLLGEYRSFIEFDAFQFAKVSATAHDPSHFERIGTETSATVSLDSDGLSIVVSGNRSNVKKAKDQVFEFLSFVLPGEIERIEISKPLQTSVGQATSLAEITATVGGATIYLDRDLGSIVIRSTDQDQLKRARSLIQEKVEEAEKLVYVLQLEPSDSWLLPLIVGKNGNRISPLEENSGCEVDVSKESRTVTIRGETEDKVAELRELLARVIEKARRENSFFSVPEAAIAAFIGKGASNVKELSTEYGVDIQRLRKGKDQFKISGDEQKIENVKGAIGDWLSKWEESRANIQISVEKQLIAAVLGTKGETARSIEQDFGCRVDIDRDALTITLRGGNKAKRQGALEKIEAIIAKEKQAKTEAIDRRKETEPTSQESKTGQTQQNAVLPTGSFEKPIAETKSRVYTFPTVPVGVSAANWKKQKAPPALEAGTATGRSLFQILLADPVPESISGGSE
jgi:polyribonucleotide nucleotidyltransferase